MMNSNFKKISIIIWGVLFILFAFFLYKFMQKKTMREYYQLGIESYNAGYYDVAESYFKLALDENPTHDEQCPIRINEALSIVTPITPESVNEDNLDEAIARLEEARDILVEDGCANMDDNNGHNESAQTLKNEIDEYIEYLKNPPPPSDGSSDDQDENNESDSSNQNQNQQQQQQQQQQTPEQQEEQKLREEFEQIQQQGMEERQSDLDNSEESSSYEYYGGKNW